jgi:hypothetical protein
MTDDRKRAEDVYRLLEAHKEWTEGRLAALAAEMAPAVQSLPQISGQLGVLLKYVVGPVKVHTSTGEPIINGGGEPIRDESQGLVAMRSKMSARQLMIVSVSHLAAVITALALLVN